MSYPSRPLALRFAEKVIPEPNSGCFLWLGMLNGEGYGRIRRDRSRRMLMAHRVAWELVHGPIPKGLDALHRCDNPPCVNERHLFVGTRADNNRDAAAKGRNVQQKKTHCPVGHPYDAENTRLAYGRRRCK